MDKKNINPLKGGDSALSSSEKLSLEEIVFLANKVGLEYAAAKKKVDRYELLKGIYRSKLMEKHDNGQRSEAKIKRLAEIDEEYVQFVEKLAEAKFICEELKIRYESYKNLFEARRSMLSYQKAEMKLI